MRFSVLTLNARDLPDGKQAGSESLEGVARYIAEHNVSCVCLQDCEQAATAPVVDAESGVSADNLAYRLSARLNTLGLKYEMVWSGSPPPEGGNPIGCAILGQLPILATSRAGGVPGASSDPPACAVAARLAVAPGILIDAYTASIDAKTDGGAEYVARLRDFVSRSGADLARRSVLPRRRGRPPRSALTQAPPEPVRIVLLAGDMPDDPNSPVTQALLADGFADASRLAGPTSANSRKADTVTPDYGWAAHVYIRPGIKPTDVSPALADDARTHRSQRCGLLLGFEV